MGAIVTAVAALAAAGALTACGSSASSGSSAGAADGGTTATSAAVSLATSLAAARDSWAVLPMSANPVFWEMLVRPTASATWRLVTPPGVADNGGLVAATSAGSLTVAVRPSQNLLFSPLAATANAGATWSAGGPLTAAVAASPDALAADGRNLAAVLGDGAIEVSANAGAAWRTVARPGAIAASPAGRGCGAVTVTSVTFGMADSELLAGGTCGTTGTTAIFARSSSGTWQRLSLAVAGRLVRMFADGPTLVAAKAGLTALWSGSVGTDGAISPGASASPPAAGDLRSAPLPVTSTITASGELVGATSAGGDGIWVLLPGGRAATIGGPGKQWLLLPPVPAGAKVLASGPKGAVDALSVAGATVTVWRLPRAATVWTKIQTIAVPIQYGSSS